MRAFDRMTTVAQIVLDHPECANVLSEHRIDFCCRGNQGLAVACKERSVDVDALLARLDAAIAGRTGAPAEDPRTMPTPALVAHIVSRHHAYLYDALPFLLRLAAKVARVHGEHNPKLPALHDAVALLATTLEAHAREEERSLFPAMLAPNEEAVVVGLELDGVLEEHLRVAEMLRDVHDLADGFVAPEWACGSYRTLLAELAALELDTLRHVHLENHVLMPRFTGMHTEAAPERGCARPAPCMEG
jgi:regulator of cell morphogenesis and NO signaling